MGLTCILGGICFELRDTPSVSLRQGDQNNYPPTSYVMLKVGLNPPMASCKTDICPQSVPLPLRALFDQYFQLGHRIRKHYLSPTVILLLVTGQFLPPIHRKSLYSLQYSMLPAQRADVVEVWTRLTEQRSRTAKEYAKLPNGTTMQRNRRG